MVIALPRIRKRTFVPASSAPSERAFSSAGLTVLTGEHVQAINFLYMNEDVLQIGLSVSVFCAFFEVHLLMILQHCIALILLASQILDSTFVIRNQLRFGYGHPYV